MASVGCDDGVVHIFGPPECAITPDLLRRYGAGGGGTDVKTPSWANGTPMLTDLVKGFADVGNVNGGNGPIGGKCSNIGNTEGGLMAQMMEEHERAIRAEMWAASGGGGGAAAAAAAVATANIMHGVAAVPGTTAVHSGMEGMWVLGLHDESQYHGATGDGDTTHIKEVMDTSEVSSENGKRDGSVGKGSDIMVDARGASPIGAVAKREDVLLDVDEKTNDNKTVDVKMESPVLKTIETPKGGSIKRKKKVAIPFECPAQQAKKNRAAAIKRLKQKKLLRTFKKKVRYQCRKKIALHRPRVRGRFATKEEVERFKAMK